MRKVTEIIIHCSATAPGWMAGLSVDEQAAEIDRWHKANGWSGIGYHYVVGRDGTIATGRDIELDGAHVAGRNTGTIGICLIGGRGSSATDQPEQHYTTEQLDAARDLVDSLRTRFGPVPVTGHNQFSAKACPGFNAPRWMAGKGPRKITESRTVVAQAAVATGTAGASAMDLLAQDLQNAQSTLQPLADMAPILKWAFIAVVFAGVARTLWVRIDDWRNGKR